MCPHTQTVSLCLYVWCVCVSGTERDVIGPAIDDGDMCHLTQTDLFIVCYAVHQMSSNFRNKVRQICITL